MDFIKKLLSFFRFDTILVIINQLTKQAIFIPTYNTITSADLVYLFVFHVFSKHSVPFHITSNRGSEFVSNFFCSLGTTLDMWLHFISSYHHEDDEQTECTNQTLKQYLYIVISQTPKHVWDMFNFNMTSNLRGYLVLFVSKTPSVVWYFIMDLIPPKVRGYFALFESKSAVIFICIHCLIISFKLRKFTQILCGVFPSPSLNFYIVFH